MHGHQLEKVIFEDKSNWGDLLPEKGCNNIISVEGGKKTILSRCDVTYSIYTSQLKSK